MSSPTLSLAVQKQRINVLRVIFIALLPLILFTHSAWEPHPAVHEMLEAAGALLVIAGVLGRFWAILYAGGRKNQVVLQDGPYSICRHPLYLFSTTAILGFGLLLGSFIVTVVFGGLTFLILMMTARMEERKLVARFGADYSDYAARVPRIVPNLSLFHTPNEVTFAVAHLRVNFRDALVFLALLPLAELIEYLHEAGHLPSISIY